MIPIFFYINIYFFIKNITFYKILRYLYKKEKYEKYYFIYINYIMHCADMFNKGTATQNNGLGENTKC